MPTIINGQEVISASLDKAKFFTMIFVSNSTLDDKGYLIREFLRFTSYYPSNIFITDREVSRYMKRHGPENATDKISVIVLKNINRCLKEKSSLSV